MRCPAILALGFFFLQSFPGFAQSGQDAYHAFWQKTDSAFRDIERSPLPQDQVATFDSVPRYAYQPDFHVMARWAPSPQEKPFELKTTTDRKPRYQKLGSLHFRLLDADVELPVYINVDPQRKSLQTDRVFIPFTDLSNGHTTYMGGRYLDMEMFENDSVEIDFNLAYNPYCVYSERYSCPIPPPENYIPVFIAAGARAEQKY